MADDGVGLPGHSQRRVDGGNGLPGMRARARAIGGRLEIGAREGGGTQLDLYFSPSRPWWRTVKGR